MTMSAKTQDLQVGQNIMPAAEIRQQFLDFFKSKGHAVVPSAPIVVKNDPTLLFTNAGMNQFKDYFLGNKTPKQHRIVDTQKCLRVSGKHNDLEEVGVDTYHHTMFEMLGNWSFGDYFKKEAITWSWELLTEIYKIPTDRIYVTYFEGDLSEGLEKDEEAYQLWKQLVQESHILPGNKKDNFWEMGETGPCGPCSEIHVDCRSEGERMLNSGAALVNADHPQVIEIWNNVFMQFNRLKDGSLQQLPAKHVDTGMGFERLVRVLQGKSSNYDTDVFSGTITAIEKITGKEYLALAQPDEPRWGEAVAFRVLADHIRAISFTVADGQLPSNTGAGYVIRRILRRAVRYYYTYLDHKTPLLHQLVPILATQFEHVFGELKQQQEFVAKVIREEEEAFLRTLEKGLKRVDEIMAAQVIKDTPAHSTPELNNPAHTISGTVAFELNDTYGFPIDLTELIARERGWVVDMEGFKVALQQQKDRSRAATTLDTSDWVTVHTDLSAGFVGYQDLLVQTKVLKYRKVVAKGKEQYQIVLASTPFYAESGGQIGDQGFLQFGDQKITVNDTKKENDLIVHFTDELPAAITQEVTASVNWEQRIKTTYNHTATHLLHAALREVLGNHVTQKGSLVSGEVLRFDFSHFAKLTEEELVKINVLVNEKIRASIPVTIQELPKEAALQLGAMALFGEKYGATVRVVTIDPAYSVELCGGTHVSQTGMIGIFVITSETAVAAGVRRIEALTGPAAIYYIQDRISQFKFAADLLKAKEPIKALEKLIDDKSKLEKKLEKLEARHIITVKNELLKEKQSINNISFIGTTVEADNPDVLRKLCMELKNNLEDYVLVLCSVINGKPSVAIAMSESILARQQLDSVKIVKEWITPMIKGGGGGQKTLAIAGGQDVSQIDAVIDKVKNWVTNM